ncbi:hypothetical protein [Microbacterium sp. 10M-3C3]|jgi:hypothetical protein|uniref:hypothetical protein n=1 Tax=Microbacterium sp. 10M-3C3 TaxID=2483401 RepID=UPI000F63F34F|nr:hypothetical protein [Microbacterium sp. 10M-3C3]
MRTIASAVLVGVLLGAPATVNAAEGNYTPVNPSAPTLAGSAVAAGCSTGDPIIDYRVQVTDPPDGVVADATLVLGTGSRAVTVALGTVTAAGISGSVPWPSDAMADPSTTATIRLEPQVADPLTLPLSATTCAQPAALGGLAATGLPSWVPALGIVGVALVAFGAVLRPFRRRREG